jgi:hypothetical protein
MAIALRSKGRLAAQPANVRPGSCWAPRWRAVLFPLLLLALLVQGTAIQTHLHFAQRPSSVAVATSDSRVRNAKSGPDDSAVCPLCREAAIAGTYLLPPAIIVPLLANVVVWTSTAKLTEFELLAQPLGWLSRAPPR